MPTMEFSDDFNRANWDNYEQGILAESASASELRINIGQSGNGVRII